MCVGVLSLPVRLCTLTVALRAQDEETERAREERHRGQKEKVKLLCFHRVSTGGFPLQTDRITSCFFKRLKVGYVYILLAFIHVFDPQLYQLVLTK